MKQLFSVSCLLPSPDKAAPKKQTSTELDSRITGMDGAPYEVLRIGWTGAPAPDYEAREILARQLLTDHRRIPVFLNDSDIRYFFNGFCHTSLWPILHYLPGDADYDERWYNAYRTVNSLFAAKVIERYRQGDLIWIHDYHLMLVPQMIRAAIPNAKIGFFLHTPFPSYELFRCHPNRSELLTGMLGANLAGFQTFGYLRHFRSTVLRLLGIESEIHAIPHEGAVTAIGVYPVGVKCNMINEARQSPDYQRHVNEYRATFGERKMVLSVDRLDASQGLIRKLAAIEAYLEATPEARRKVVFVMLVSPSGVHSDYVEHLTQAVEHAVGRINGRFSSVGTIPIHYLNRWVSFDKVCALYTLADVALVTPLMDGMNIIAKEYIASKGRDGGGALILSEFAGASEELFNAIRVNPYNHDQMRAALTQALNMPPDEQQRRLSAMQERVTGHDAFRWAGTFIRDLEKAAAPEDSTTRSLDADVLSRFRDRSLSKALFLDYDGSLREFVDSPEDAVPSDDLIEIFEGFSRRKDLHVYIVSGRDRAFMDKHFGRFPFTLVSEHGFFVRHPGGDWEMMAGDIDLGWKDTIRNIFQMYSVSTPSTKVEEKHSALVWHYRQADPEFGAWKAAGLLGELTEALSNLPVAIHQGQKIIEVSSQHVSKGLAVARFMNENHYDLALCAGDDKTDETMLYFDDPDVITVKIGDKDTDANYRAPTPRQFRRFLKAINELETGAES